MTIDIRLSMEPGTSKTPRHNPMDLSAMLNTSTQPQDEERVSIRSDSACSGSTASPIMEPRTAIWNGQQCYRLPPISETAVKVEHTLPPCSSISSIYWQAEPRVTLLSLNTLSPQAPSQSQALNRRVARDQHPQPPRSSYQDFPEAQTNRRSPIGCRSRTPPRRQSRAPGAFWTLPMHSIAASPFSRNGTRIIISKAPRTPHAVCTSPPARGRGRSPRSSGHKAPHSNKAYDVEQVDWMRYHHEDVKVDWKDALEEFKLRWSVDPRETDQCLSSRHYRDNRGPLFRSLPAGEVKPGEDDFEIIIKNGKPVWKLFHIRARNTPQGEEDDHPYTLAEKHPRRAVTYSWVSEEHKEMAREIMREDMEMEKTGQLSSGFLFW